MKDYIEEPRVRMIQWKGNNLKEVIDFTNSGEYYKNWFKSWEEYESYVHSHENIFKIFNKDGSHYEVPVGAWIIKTPDGYNVPSNATLKPRQEIKWSGDEVFMLEDAISGLQIAEDELEKQGSKNFLAAIRSAEQWLKDLSTGFFRHPVNREELVKELKLAYGKVSMNPFDCSKVFEELIKKFE